MEHSSEVRVAPNLLTQSHNSLLCDPRYGYPDSAGSKTEVPLY
jgi:hypothetical protein